MAKYNLIGQRFGRLLVIKEAEIRRTWNCRQWTCLCDCGKTKNIKTDSLMRGLTQSCGCLQKERTSKAKFIHGHGGKNKSPEFMAWTGLKTRCYNPNSEDYGNWGGRGIIVCDRWLGENGFVNFFNDMGKRPSPKHSIDRYPNNDTGIYEPTNCRWATIKSKIREEEIISGMNITALKWFWRIGQEN